MGLSDSRSQGILSPYHEPLLKVLMPLLVDPKPLSVRKRAYVALCESQCTDLIHTYRYTYL